MARSKDKDKGKGKGKKIGRHFRTRECRFCVERIDYVDYKDTNLIRRYVSDKAKIKARRSTGTCAKHQRRLAEAIKRARFVALFSYKKEQYR